jgi:hypothetical protein
MMSAPIIGGIMKLLLLIFYIYFYAIYSILLGLAKAIIVGFANTFILKIVDMDLLKFTFFNAVYDKVLVIGFAIFILIVLFQSLKAMFGSTLGFETEESWMIFIKAILYGFLVIYAKDICIYVNDGIFKKAIKFLIEGEGPSLLTSLFANNAIQISDIAKNLTFDAFPYIPIVDALLTLLICFKLIALVFRFAERYLITSLLIIMSPLAFACGVSKATKPFLQGWMKVFIGNYTIQIFQYVGFMCLILLDSSSIVSNATPFETFGMTAGLFKRIFIYLLADLIGKSEDIVREVGLSFGVGSPMSGPIGFAGEKLGSITSIKYGFDSSKSMLGFGSGAGDAGGVVGVPKPK